MDLLKKMFKRIYLYGEMVMFSHTLFSLPFALLTLFLAANGLPEFRILILSLIALVSARTGANAFNRYADRFIDAENPRTSTRHIPKGILKSSEALFVTLVSYVIYFIAAYFINELVFIFAVVPIIFFTIYPYTKRFTYLCHLFLGIACAFAVIGAWMAVRNELFFIFVKQGKFIIDFYSINPIPIILFIAVMLWNAGFDIIYGTMDISHDQSHSIFSIPARFGLKFALWISRSFHFIMILLLILLIFLSQLGYLFGIGIGLSSILFLLEHNIVKPHNHVIMKLASYKLNQMISITLFTFATIDIFL